MTDNHTRDQIDLFGDPPTQAGSEEHAGRSSAAAVEDPRERDVLAYQESLEDFRRTVYDMASRLKEHCNQHVRFAGAFHFKPTELIEARAKAIFDSVIEMASESFGAYGNRIDIDDCEAHMLFFPVDDHLDSRLSRAEKVRKREAFSPLALWRFLTTRYRANGRAQALSESAARIVHQFPFGWDFDTAVKATTSATTFNVTISTEKPSKHTSRCAFQLDFRQRMSGSSSSLHSLLGDLAVFLAWANDEAEIRREFRSDVAAIADWMFHGHGCFDSRFKQQLGPIGLQWFKDKVEFRFPAPLAEKLNLFLTEYAGKALTAMMEMRR